MSDIEVTAEQMATAHPFEDELHRKTAWMFDNLLRKLAREAPSIEWVDEAVVWYGQDQMNRGHREIAAAWANFAARYGRDILAGTA